MLQKCFDQDILKRKKKISEFLPFSLDISEDKLNVWNMTSQGEHAMSSMIY